MLHTDMCLWEVQIDKKKGDPCWEKEESRMILCKFRNSGSCNLCYVGSLNIQILCFLCKKWGNHSQTCPPRLVVSSVFLRHWNERSQHFGSTQTLHLLADSLGFFWQLEVCLNKITGPEVVFWFFGFFSCLEWRAHFVIFPCHLIYMSRKCITLKSLFKIKIAYVWGGLTKRNEYLLNIERIIIL